MLRLAGLLRASSAAATAQTLTAWLSRLAEEADALPPQTLTDTQQALSSSASAASAEQLFRDIEAAATHANALRETDTLFGILHCAIKKNYFPADVDAWARLSTQLLPYEGIEASSVLHYPGQPAATAAAAASATYNGGDISGVGSESRVWTTGNPAGSITSSASASEREASRAAYQLPVTRETLLMTGGVVPLSARQPCGDGRAVALLLDNFVRFVRSVGPDHSRTTQSGSEGALSADISTSPKVIKAVRAVSKTVLQAMKTNAATLQWELLLTSVLNYLQLLHELDLLSSAAALRASKGQEKDDGNNNNNSDTDAADDAQDEGAEEENTTERAETTTAPQQTRFLQRMLNGLSHHTLAYGAHGARVSLYYLNDYFARVVERFQASGGAVHLSADDAQRLYWMEQRRFIALTRSCMRAIYLYYTPESTAPARAARQLSPAADLVLAAPMHGKIESLYDQIDVIFQENTNASNALHLQVSAAAQLKDVHTLALLRALRMEEVAPDAYLRRALEVVDRVPASMAIEGELIAGKVRLLDLDSDTVDEAGRTAVYNDLLTSLRSLVEMRPRFARLDSTENEAATEEPHESQDSSSSSSSSSAVHRNGEAAGQGEDASDGDEASAVQLDAVTQAILQRAHADVIEAFCAAHKDEWSNEAYSILVTHKYHGLKITKELILPVLEVFSRRGDCRAFNLVDLCVLYSNEPVDMQTVALLFRTCAVAGDHYRARTFLQLLNEIIPGFLVKCPPSVKESLQELKLLDLPPRHLFVSAEEDLVQNALGKETRAVRRLPDVA